MKKLENKLKSHKTMYCPNEKEYRMFELKEKVYYKRKLVDEIFGCPVCKFHYTRKVLEKYQNLPYVRRQHG